MRICSTSRTGPPTLRLPPSLAGRLKIASGAAQRLSSRSPPSLVVSDLPPELVIYNLPPSLAQRPPRSLLRFCWFCAQSLWKFADGFTQHRCVYLPNCGWSRVPYGLRGCWLAMYDRRETALTYKWTGWVSDISSWHIVQGNQDYSLTLIIVVSCIGCK